MAGMAALAAMASFLEIIPFDLRVPFPLLTFLTFDPTGIPIAVAAVLYGPLGAFVTAGIAGITIATRNPVSAAFKTTAEMSTAIPLALTLWGLRGREGDSSSRTWALLGLAGAVAVVSRVAVMTGFNLVFLPLLLGIPEAVVVGLLLPIAIFNAAQAVINVVPAYLIVRGLPPDLRPSWLAWGAG
ncbi:MAG: hypothetical protein ACE5I4_02620 [Thermoplasmata archaeon]